jgi:hypothetical protein
MTVESAPLFVLDAERLVRTCGSGDIKGGGRVKHRAFLATVDPLEISVHRDEYCDEACRDRAKAAVMVMAGQARQLPSGPSVDGAAPPIDHAQITLPGAPAIKTKDELLIEEHAALWAKHDALCRELASIAVPCKRAGLMGG